jgi:hypothetical protein
LFNAGGPDEADCSVIFFMNCIFIFGVSPESPDPRAPPFAVVKPLFRCAVVLNPPPCIPTVTDSQRESLIQQRSGTKKSKTLLDLSHPRCKLVFVDEKKRIGAGWRDPIKKYA